MVAYSLGTSGGVCANVHNGSVQWGSSGGLSMIVRQGAQRQSALELLAGRGHWTTMGAASPRLRGVVDVGLVAQEVSAQLRLRSGYCV